MLPDLVDPTLPADSAPVTSDDSSSDAQARALAEYERLKAMQVEWMASLPAALEPAYPFVPANASIPLYKGPLRFDTPNGTYSMQGVMEIAWEPSPRLRYASAENLPLELAPLVFGQVNADGYPEDTTVVPDMPSGTWDPVEEPTADGYLTHLDIGSGDEFSHVTFGIANFMDYLGAWVRHDEHAARGRVEMVGCGWHLTIDDRHDKEETFKHLKRRGGYAVTHVGQVRRSDGRSFNRSEAQEILDGLYWFLSFVKGSACGPLLPVGFDQSGAATWARWGVPTIARWPGSIGWADEHRPEELARLFPGFIEKWLDTYWRRAVYIGVGYYLEANGPTTVERALSQAQVVLEMLAHAVLVEGGHKTLEDLKPIGVGIARLLEHFGVPIEIPEELPELRAEAKGAGWESGPWAVTALRNEIIHAKRGASERPFRVTIQAWKLISWYVELVLLALFGFDGEYGSRLKWPRWVGQVELVPWATPGGEVEAAALPGQVIP